jgi:hypothetical protein
LNAEFGEGRVGFFDFSADIGQPAIFFMFGDIMRINRHDHAAQPVTREIAHVLLGPQRAVGADHRVDAAFGCVTNHGAQIFMDQWFAADEEEIADVIFDGDVDDVLRFLERDATAHLGIETIDREAAEIAFGVADVGDGELQIARTTMRKDFAKKFERTFLRLNHRARKIRLTLAGRNWNCL